MKKIFLFSFVFFLLFVQIVYASSLSVSSTNTVSFNNIKLNGLTQSTAANVPSLFFSDTTGTGDGFHITAQATQFSDTSTGRSLPLNSLSLSSSPSIIEQASDGLNLVANAGFENGNNSNGIGEYWYNESSGGSASFNLITTPTHTGNYAQSFSTSALPNGDEQKLYQPIPSVTPNASFTSSTYLDATSLSGINLMYEVDWFNSSDTYLSSSISSTVETTSNSSYTLFSVSGTVPASAASANVVIFFQSTSASGSGTCYVDDVNYQENHNTLAQSASLFDTNGGFETDTQTYQVYKTTLTQQNSWNIATGGFSFSSNGATSTSAGSLLENQTLSWRPMTGSSGGDQPLTLTATFTEPTTATESVLRLNVAGSSQNYEIYWDNNNVFGIWINSASVSKALVTTPLTLSGGGTYTFQISINTSHLITGKIYAGTGTGGTLLANISTTDTTLNGPYYPAVYANLGITTTSLHINAAFPNNWAPEGNTTGEYATRLVNDAFSGKNAVEVYSTNPTSGQDGFDTEVESSVTAGKPFTASCEVYVKTLVSSEVFLEIDWSSSGTYLGSTSWHGTVPTGAYQPLYFTGTVPATATSAQAFVGILSTSSSAVGDAIFDQVQLLYGKSTPPSLTGADWILDSGSPSTILSAPVFTGMGNYYLSFPSNSLKLTISPSTTFSGSYSSTLNWSIISGP